MAFLSEAALEQALRQQLRALGYSVEREEDIGPDGHRPERQSHAEVVLMKRLEDAVARLGEVAEGVNTLKVLKNKAEELQVYMPLVAGLHAILFEGRTLEQVIQALMRGEPKTDVDFISPSGF